MNFEDLLKINNLDAKEFRLVRHGYKEIDPLSTFQNDPKLFAAYQAFQSLERFEKAKYIAVFAPHHGTHSLFLGIWRIEGQTSGLNAPEKAKDMVKDMIKKFEWDLAKGLFYTLTKTEIISELSERLIIEWGKSTVSWVQRKSNKPVISILPPAHIQEFKSYEQTVINRSELKKMINNPTNNATWHNALRAVNGVYCITNTKNGKLYIGSAYGKNGIWGRWMDYANTGHGGNESLIELLQNNPKSIEYFQYSILEILPGSSTPHDAVTKENLWKERLGSREHGYNDKELR